MAKLFRAAFVGVGLAITIYGVASLAGRWLGEPPWWTREVAVDRALWWRGQGHEYVAAYSGETVRVAFPRPGRARYSVALATAGLALAIAAWPRQSARARPAAPAPPARFDARRLLFIPSYLAAVGVAAALSDDWYSLLVAQRGAFAPWDASGGAGMEGVITVAFRLVLLACVIVPTIMSIRRLSIWWVLLLVPAWFFWLLMGWPSVWRA